jgi:hypothetical protein
MDAPPPAGLGLGRRTLAGKERQMLCVTVGRLGMTCPAVWKRHPRTHVGQLWTPVVDRFRVG